MRLLQPTGRDLICLSVLLAAVPGIISYRMLLGKILVEYGGQLFQRDISDVWLDVVINVAYRLMNSMCCGRWIGLSTQCASSAGIMIGLALSKESRLVFCYRQN